MLEQLIAKDIDRRPAVRKQLVSAMLLGGNVLVKRSTRRRRDLPARPRLPLGDAARLRDRLLDLDQVPPANSLFGRTDVAGEQVLCTNPAALGGGAANVDPVFPSQHFARGHADRLVDQRAQAHPAHRVDHLGLASRGPTARGARRRAAPTCSRSRALGGAQTPQPAPDPTWGLHLLDANIALGNLVSVVHDEVNALRGAGPIGAAGPDLGTRVAARQSPEPYGTLTYRDRDRPAERGRRGPRASGSTALAGRIRSSRATPIHMPPGVRRARRASEGCASRAGR